MNQREQMRVTALPCCPRGHCAGHRDVVVNEEEKLLSVQNFK